MSVLNREPDKRYTYADYLNWDDNERWELIDGIPFNMTPAPGTKHQRVSGRLFNQFFNYLDDKTCEVFTAPFDVRLEGHTTKNEEILHSVQPDIVVICDKNKIDEKGCKGSPDLIVEVLSPSTSKLDKQIKKKTYENFKIKEYWIVDPLNENVEVFVLTEGRYIESRVFEKNDDIKVGIFDGFMIKLNSIFVTD